MHIVTAFKPKFAGSAAALELSQHFVMVNTIDNEEPKETKYEPDGGYIPRILFLGKLRNLSKKFSVT